MRLSQPRVPPVTDESSLDPDARESLGATSLGPAVNIFRTLIRHPKLFKRWLVFANHILFKATIPARDREILILRTGWRCRAEYEWGQHVVIGKAVGLTDGEILRITEGPDASEWEPFDATLVRAADELHDDDFISDATWKALAERYSTQQLMDAVFTVGQYTLVSMALNSFGVQLDPDVPGFPR
ncbi:MAG TPA: carboxymuconolactone decarboxylase family protein [Actinomycetota bacterium]|nr:carboxymuconolactone decarboxylase family protein [Actinomycetota bacterium]